MIRCKPLGSRRSPAKQAPVQNTCLRVLLAVCLGLAASICTADALAVPGPPSPPHRQRPPPAVRCRCGPSNGRDCRVDAASAGKGDGSEGDFSARDDAAGGGNRGSGGWVSVEVRREVFFPPAFASEHEGDPLAAASSCVREAWLEHHWKRGGGLPILVYEKKQGPGTGTRTSGSETSEGLQRVIAPVMMEETISSLPSQPIGQPGDPAATLDLVYKVTSPGPLFGNDLVPGSHLGRVTFSSDYSSQGNNTAGEKEAPDGIGSSSSRPSGIVTTMTWKVGFETTRLWQVYQNVTEFTIGTASRTVAEAAGTPRLLTLRAELSVPEPPGSGAGSRFDAAEAARREWLGFLFSAEGGGLPLPPPLPLGGSPPGEAGAATRSILRFPPGLVETATLGGTSPSVAHYRLENPGWWTFPFLAHTHLGRVTFRPLPAAGDLGEGQGAAAPRVGMVWEVEMRPYPFAGPVVEALTEATISTIAKNLSVRLSEPGARVPLLLLPPPPRGARSDTPGPGSVSGATWIGRVLDARRSDQRPGPERALSLLRPWTWGEREPSTKGGCGCEFEYEFEWSDRAMDEPRGP